MCAPVCGACAAGECGACVERECERAACGGGRTLPQGCCPAVARAVFTCACAVAWRRVRYTLLWRTLSWPLRITGKMCHGIRCNNRDKRSEGGGVNISCAHRNNSGHQELGVPGSELLQPYARNASSNLDGAGFSLPLRPGRRTRLSVPRRSSSGELLSVSTPWMMPSAPIQSGATRTGRRRQRRPPRELAAGHATASRSSLRSSLSLQPSCHPSSCGRDAASG